MNQSHDQIAAAVTLGAEQAVETDLAQRAEHGDDMAVRQRAGDGQGLLPGRDDRAALEQGAQPFEQLARPGAQTDLGQFDLEKCWFSGGGRVARLVEIG